MLRFPVIALILTCSLSACDAGPDRLDAPVSLPGTSLRLVSPLELEVGPDDVAFREQGKPWEVYLPVARSIDDFAKMLQTCSITPALTVSLSGYLPDVSVTDEQVVGFGFSMMATQELKDCMYGMMIKQGAIEI